MNQTHPKITKRCRICGDKALGFNYNGLCCESCKIFFLRNSHKKLECVRMGNCTIDITTRKSCSKCRLQKCFENKMFLSRKDNDESLFLFKQENITGDFLHKYIQTEVNKIDFKGDFNYQNSVSSILPPIPSFSTVTQKKRFATELLPYERSLIYDMQNMYSDKFVDESKLKIVGKIDTIFDAFNFMENYGRRIVKFCKSIPAFGGLHDADQLAILKSFYMDVLGIRFAFLWDDKRGGCPVMENETGNQAIFFCLEHAMQAIDPKHTKANLQLQRHLQTEMENDFTIRDLLMALFLFKPKDNLKCPENVGYHHFVYCRLLRRYLKHKYRNIKQADRKFTKLVKLVQQIAVIKESGRVVLDEIDTSRVSPLVLELIE